MIVVTLESMIVQKALENPDDLVIGEYPADYGTPSTVYKISMGFAISKNTEHPKEAAALLEYMLNGDGVKTLGTERGVPASAKAQKTLADADLLKGMVADAAKASAANYVFPLSPYYEDASLKDSAEGAYASIMEAMSYDKADSHDLAKQMTEAVNAAEAQA